MFVKNPSKIQFHENPHVWWESRCSIRTTSSQSIFATALQEGLKPTVVIASTENNTHL